MIGAANPIDAPEAYDFVTIQGVNTPGRCKVGEFKRVVDWDVKTGKGTAGATETVKGLPPAKGSIQFFVWESAHFAAWDALLPMLKYDPTKKTKQANSIYHPFLADIDVDSVNIEAIGSWVEVSAGEYARTIEFLEFAPPVNKSVSATPTGASEYASKDPKNGPPGAQPDPAITAMQKEAAALAKEAQKAYGG